MVFDYVQDTKISHIIIAHGKFISCVQFVTEAIDPEIFSTDYVLFGLHSTLATAYPILHLNYMQNGLCCFIDCMGQFGIYNIRKHLASAPNTKVVNSYVNLVKLKQQDVKMQSFKNEENLGILAPIRGGVLQSSGNSQTELYDDGDLSMIDKPGSQEFDLDESF